MNRFSLLLASLALTASVALAYDSPNLDLPLFDRDALQLTANDRDTIVEALNAIGGNFPDSERIDDDLREKSLLVALNLDPLNVNARGTHRSLVRGRPTLSSSYFTSSVSEVAEQLWSSADKLAGKKMEAEANRLSLYLRELSLVLHPSPPVERVRAYAKMADGQPQNWKKHLELQPGVHPSGNRLKRLIDEASEKQASAPKPPTPPAAPKRPATAPDPAQELKARAMADAGKGKAKGPGAKGKGGRLAERMEIPDAAPIKLREIEIPYIARTRGLARERAHAGVASLSIRDADLEQDMELFRPREGVALMRALQMKIVEAEDSMNLQGTRAAEKLVRDFFPVWPGGLVAEASFTSKFPLRSPPKLTEVDNLVPTTLLLASAFKGEKPHSGIMYSGYVEYQDGQPEFSFGEGLAAALEQLGYIEDIDYLVMPESAYQEVLAIATETGELDYLFSPQMISYSSWEQLQELAFGDVSPRDQAAAALKEIYAVQGQMTLPELAKNAKVQERLIKLLQSYPQHLSARVMLEHGGGKLPE